MKAYGILEGVIENTNRLCNPAIYDFCVCETGFTSRESAEQSLINTGWINHHPNYVKLAIGADAWSRPTDEEREKDEYGYEIERVRYVFEMEVDI